jgi:hypothetical protein
MNDEPDDHRIFCQWMLPTYFVNLLNIFEVTNINKYNIVILHGIISNNMHGEKN